MRREQFPEASTMQIYLDQMGQRDLLTAEQEVELGTTIQSGIAAEQQLEQLRANGESPPVELYEQIHDGHQAQNTMVEANLRLVVSIAKKYNRPSVPLEDQIQDGNIGLLRAAQKFDPEKGFKFSTYATWWVRQSIQRGAAAQGGPIKTSENIQTDIRNVRRTREFLASQNPNVPVTNALVAEFLEVPVNKIGELDRVASIIRLVRSLQEPVDNSNKAEGPQRVLADFIGSLDDDIESIPERDEVAVQKYLSLLDERSGDMVRLRYGFGDTSPETLDKIAEIYDISKERVRQILKKAHERMRIYGPHSEEDLGVY